MFSEELTKVILQVLKSWQVLVITVVLIFYIYLVKYVARRYHRPHFVSKSKPKPKPKQKKEKPDKKTLSPNDVISEV